MTRTWTIDAVWRMRARNDWHIDFDYLFENTLAIKENRAICLYSIIERHGA